MLLPQELLFLLKHQLSGQDSESFLRMVRNCFEGDFGWRVAEQKILTEPTKKSALSGGFSTLKGN